MEMNKELGQIIHEEGGLFTLNNTYDQSVIFFFETLSARFNRNLEFAKSIYIIKPLPINYVFINSMQINAFAYTTSTTEASQFDFIAINAGVPFALLNIFLRMLSHPNLFIDIGNPDKEKLSDNNFQEIEEILFNPDHISLIPKCKIRELYAHELALCALDFIFCHELAHLHRGHCNYDRQYFQKLYISEAFETPNDFFDSLFTSQCMELDADIIGIRFTYRLMSKIGLNFKNIPIPTKEPGTSLYSAMHAIYAEPEKAFRALSISTYTFFRIFAGHWSPEKQIDKKHPNPEIRMLTIFEPFMPNGVQPDITVEKFNLSLAVNMSAAEECIAAIQGKDIDLRPIHNIFTLQEHGFDNYINELFSKRNDLIPKLKLYMRGDYLYGKS